MAGIKTVQLFKTNILGTVEDVSSGKNDKICGTVIYLCSKNDNILPKIAQNWTKFTFKPIFINSHIKTHWSRVLDNNISSIFRSLDKLLSNC